MLERIHRRAQEELAESGVRGERCVERLGGGGQRGRFGLGHGAWLYRELCGANREMLAIMGSRATCVLLILAACGGNNAGGDGGGDDDGSGSAGIDAGVPAATC